MKELSYFSALGQSWKLLWKYPAVLIPFAITTLLSLIFTPWFTLALSHIQSWSLMDWGKMLLFWIMWIIIGFLFYGWNIILLRQLVQKKVSVSQSFSEIVPQTWRIVKIWGLIVLLILLVSVVFAILGLIGGLVPLLLILIVPVLFLSFIMLGVLGYGYFMQLIPLIILEKTNARETLQKGYVYYRQHFSRSLGHAFLSLLLLLILEMPYLIFTFLTRGFGQLAYPWHYSLIGQILMIPVALLSLCVGIAYCLLYQK